MSGRGVTLVVGGLAALVAGVIIGRNSHADTSRPEIGTTQSGGAIEPAAPPIDPERAKRLQTSLVGLADRLAKIPVNNELDRAVLATLEEPSPVREARRTAALSQIRQALPTLSADKVDFMLQETDKSVAAFRRYRAAFMLGQLTEREYLDAIKQERREFAKSFAAKMTREEYQILMGTNLEPGDDPFDSKAYEQRATPPKIDCDIETDPNCDSSSDPFAP